MKSHISLLLCVHLQTSKQALYVFLLQEAGRRAEAAEQHQLRQERVEAARRQKRLEAGFAQASLDTTRLPPLITAWLELGLGLPWPVQPGTEQALVLVAALTYS